jgi:hypothetical protein
MATTHEWEIVDEDGLHENETHETARMLIPEGGCLYRFIVYDRDRNVKHIALVPFIRAIYTVSD